MTIQLMDPTKLVPSKANPRKVQDLDAVEALAESIARDGILQNLIGRFTDPKETAVEIIAGNRRLAAVKRLIDRGDWPKGQKIPVRVEPLENWQALRLATVENVQRQSLHPMDEAEAIAAMLSDKDVPTSTEDVAKALGKSVRYVQLRRAMADKLSAPTKKAFRADQITVQTARVLAQLADKKAQAGVLADMAKNAFYTRTAERIAEELGKDLPLLENAVFDQALYTGERVEVDADREGKAQTLCKDRLAFMALQRQACEKLADETIAAGWKWAEVMTWEEYNKVRHDYGHEDKKAKAGVLLVIGDDGDVMTLQHQLHPKDKPAAAPEGQKKKNGKAAPAAEDMTAEEIAAQREKDLADGKLGRPTTKKKRPLDVDKTFPTKVGLDLCHVAKTETIRKAIMDGGVAPAMTLAILSMMCSADFLSLQASNNADYGSGTQDPRSKAVDEALAPFRAKFGKLLRTDSGYWWQLRLKGYSGRESSDDAIREQAYSIIVEMDQAERERLFACLVAANVGIYPRGLLGDPAAVAQLAADLNIADSFDMDQEFLDTVTKPGLILIWKSLRDEQPAGQQKDLLHTVEQFAKEKATEMRAMILKLVANKGTEYVPFAARFGTAKELTEKAKAHCKDIVL